MSDVSSAVAGTVADLFGEAAVAEETPNSPDAVAEVPQETAPAVELPDLNDDLPDELAAFLEEPDFEEVETTSLVSERFREQLADGDEFVDPDELARENAKLKKRLEWAEQQKAKAEQAKWQAEARKHFPYANVDSINATSRRAFLKQARAMHESNKALIAPQIEALRAKEAALRAEVEAKVKAELAEAWGKPNLGGGPSGAPVEAAAAADELQRARNSRNLAGIAKALMNSNNL